jgi:hypothetical protein
MFGSALGNAGGVIVSWVTVFAAGFADHLSDGRADRTGANVGKISSQTDAISGETVQYVVYVRAREPMPPPGTP